MGFKKGNTWGRLNKGHPDYVSKEVRATMGIKISIAKKGKPMSDANRRALQAYWDSKKGKNPGNGAKVSAALKGRKKSHEHVAKVAAANRGKKHPSRQGENHHFWRGEMANYDSLHNWVARYRGNKKECSSCGLDDPKRTYHWANYSGEYKRDLEDWVRLCVPCHSKMDNGRNSMAKIWEMHGNKHYRRILRTSKDMNVGRTFTRLKT